MTKPLMNSIARDALQKTRRHTSAELFDLLCAENGGAKLASLGMGAHALGLICRMLSRQDAALAAALQERINHDRAELPSIIEAYAEKAALPYAGLPLARLPSMTAALIYLAALADGFSMPAKDLVAA